MPSLTNEIVIQGLIGFFLLLWALKDALKARKDTIKAATPTNPMVAAVSMAWDRDMQQQLLETLERIAQATEAQASAISEAQRLLADQEHWQVKESLQDVVERLRQLDAPVTSHQQFQDLLKRIDVMEAQMSRSRR